MAIALKQKIAEDIANLLASNVASVKVYFDDNSTLDLATTNNTEHDQDNNCYYANISFLISLTSSKTAVKYEFFNENGDLLFVDDGTLSESLNVGDNYVTRKLKISYVV